MIDIDVMQDASEIVHYDNPKIPIYIREGLLSSYPDMKALCHWHEDIELIYIIDGEMNYEVNGHKILLRQGDTIMINSRQMHYGYSHYNKECSFLCILFHPSLLMTQKELTQQYVKPITDNPYIECIPCFNDSQLASLLRKILEIKNSETECYEFEILSVLFHVWSILYQTCKDKHMITVEKPQPNDLLIQKKMVSFLYQNYRESLSLDDIAAAGNVSRSKCCILFAGYLKQSPIDFLNSYRLEVSCKLLTDTNETISSIAFACGFNHLSYYSKIFSRKYHCTPSEFRKHTSLNSLTKVL